MPGRPAILTAEELLVQQIRSLLSGGGGGGGVTDHGALTGLGDDDHTHYLNQTRGDARYSVLSHNHTGTYDPAGTAASAVAAHAASADPHPTYLTASEGNAAYAVLAHGHSNVVAGGAAGYMTGTDKTKLDGLGTATQYAQSTAAQGPGLAADTYLAGSYIVIPAGSLKVGTRYHCVFDVTKTAAGVATPIINVRVGTAGAIGDTSRATLTFLAQTAVADDGTFDVWITVRAVGASAVLQVVSQCRHRLSVTGLQNQPGTTVRATSAAFDITPANTGIGISVNGGASAAWTVQLVQAELMNLT